MYHGDGAYILLLIVTAVLGMGTQAHIKRTYKKWSEIDGSDSGTGAEVARRMLDSMGANDVGIVRTSGHLSDYYDPRDNKLHLSDENFDGGSVASVAVACHEAGHAVQNANGYAPMKIRTAIVPVVNFTQQAWVFLFMLGLITGMFGLAKIAVLLFAFSVVFQLVTLPVEIDASRRAVAYLGQSGSAIDERGARKVLTAAALTYVAAALVSILQLLYYASRVRER
ncbi:zinc metallopeptidase [Atopobium sp. oral taxon 810]|uniref:zinc metallopeptidase n=1 Tax=Atopobium sp. oral taxon 810 TaxID=712158 RepID=UPI000397C194|nr:zinc metallopeptidase [Atopobium sp. oral taxon 810]ERI04694.1 putative neutral zinc metallopeptidase [Atopobium sp. oral taxon 810 str. F0209]